MFAKSFIDDMFDLCKLFRPDAVFIMSNDNKARMKLLDVTAANLRAPILIHIEYKSG